MPHNLKRWHAARICFMAKASAAVSRRVFDAFITSAHQFFSDKARAIAEMIRVAKRERRIVIIDEPRRCEPAVS